MSAPKAVAFDAFGTLCDLAEPRSPYLRIASALGIPVRTLWRRALTQPDPLDGLAVVDRGALEGAMTELCLEIASFRIYPDVPPVLDELCRLALPVAIISNVATPYAELLHRAFDGQVEHLVLSCEVGYAKPDSAIFALAARRLGRDPHEILMVGDSPASDIAGARAAGMAALQICRAASPPEGALTSLEKLPALLERE